jgi:uncharacterized RDD family membrane protein YckC
MTAVYALKRMAAYIIDFVLIFTPISAAINYAERRFEPPASPEEVQRGLHAGMPMPVFSMASTVQWGVSLLAPVLITGTLIGLTGRTPGKLIMFLKVQDPGGDPPGLAQGILREIVKTVSLMFFFLGPIWALQGLVTRGETFYDQWLDLEVEDLRPYGLTETQKNWRKFQRKQARLQRRNRK